MIKLNLPSDVNKFLDLKVGDIVSLSGTIFVARDAAHKRLVQLIKNGESLPFDLKDATIYYAGPCPTPNGKVVGSVGPTSSYRMDDYTPVLLENGLKGMIGKGGRNQQVINSIIKNKAIYFSAIGGAGALYSSKVVKSELIAYPELLSEAVYRYEIKDFPVIVAIDCKGNSVY